MRDTVLAGTRRAAVDLAVIGWTACESDLNEAVAEAVADYVRAAMLAGLSEEEIRHDVLERWGGRFRDATVDVTRTLRACHGQVVAFARRSPVASLRADGIPEKA